MATIRVETFIDRPAGEVWAAVADIAAVHRRLLPGRVRDARLEGDIRILTMPDGSEIRELIISVDDQLRRLAYAVQAGQKLSLTYHHASFEVRDEGAGARLIWLTDVLPHDLAPAVRARTERGMVELKQTLESP
ncbi:hypothetical protein GCM10010172_55980 [Paractinoplanes ferrugineus]|uniref:Polyketide cyclase/dehydrase/lipid transport protein n=1 Tax=Paractinoplanes ferrugineus TaxID=113564 RepID=A0A919IXK8_9ACTN|nr:SRPBCC family protein [Actinoplanes ferrugineus]GIE10931.1 hypothetical protein Afe05nite_27710 [Actinoplanes ferrugineus]